jgi:peptide/nickel transport system permease protein
MSFLEKTIRYILNPRSNTSHLPSQAERLKKGEEPDLELPVYRNYTLWRALLNPALLLGTAITLGLIAVILFGPLWVSHDPFITTQTVVTHYDSETGKMVSPPFAPSAEHLLGTDEWGNDIVSLLVYGARVTLIAGVYVTLARVMMGTLLGSIAGWTAGSRVDRAITGMIGVVASIPALLGSMILIYALGIHNGVVVFAVALALVGWTEVAQYTRGEVIVIRKMPYIEGARALGGSDIQMLVRHVLPNLLPQLLILSFLEMGAVLLLLAELGFLEVYIGGGSTFSYGPFTTPIHLAHIAEWGSLVANGAPSLRADPHLILGPALAFFITIVGMNALGEGLRRLLQQTHVNTARLLSKRMAIFVGAFVVVSWFIVRMTGPTLSFNRVAAQFDAQQAATHMTEMAQLGAGDTTDDVAPDDVQVDPVSTYIRDVYRELEVARGWKPPGQINQDWYYGPEQGEGEVDGVFGFIDGYDAQLSAELVVLVARYQKGDMEGSADQLSSVGLILETVRLWQEQNVDPRRSLLLIAWSGEERELQEVLADPDSFGYLPASTTRPVQPALVIQLDHLASGDEELWIHPRSDDYLATLFEERAGDLGLPVNEVSYESPAAVTDDLPALAMQWANGGEAQEPELERVRTAGELLSRVLLHITRMEVY